MQDLLEATRRATADIRQKDPLAHRRRRRENRPQVPKNVHKELLGEDGKKLSKDDLKHADALWKMLDDMYETDPEEYKKFIETQMREGKEAGFQLPGQGAGGPVEEVGAGKTDSVRSTSSMGGTFTPNGGFVVKTKRRYTGDKVFLNVCSHPGVQKPMVANGNEVDANTPGQFARQIPLLISKPRQGLDSSKNPVTAFDCVFNPWVIDTLAKDNMFKVQVVELAMQWVENDHGLKVNRQWKSIKSKYKLGGGPVGNKPVPFPIEDVEAQMPPEERKKAKAKREAAQAKKKKAAAAAKAREQATAPSAPSALSSPTELLRQVRASEQQGEGEGGAPALSVSSPRSSSTDKKKAKKTLIQDLSEPEKPASKKKKKKKKGGKKSVKKGFLNSSKDALYPTGSNEGGPKTFMDKCKIVDTTKMNEAELKKTMEDYAAPGGNRAPPKKKAPVMPPAAEKKKKKKKAVKRANPVAEEEFDRIMEGADPDAFKTNVAGSSGLQKTGDRDFDSLASMLAGSGGSSAGDLSKMFGNMGEGGEPGFGADLFGQLSEIDKQAPKKTVGGTEAKAKKIDQKKHRAFMEDLGKAAKSRGYMPPMGEVETFKEATAKKAEAPKKMAAAKKDIASGYIDLGEDAWELE